MARPADASTGGGLIERARRLAAWLPALALAYPLVIWPLLAAPEPVPHADLAPPAMIELGNLNRIFFPPLALAAFAAFALQTRVSRINLLHPAIVLAGLYVAWGAITTVWAIEPDLTFRRSLLQATVMGCILLPVLAARDPEAVIARLFWLFALVAVVNLAAVALKPPGPLGHPGIYAHKNTLGAAAAMAFVFALLQAFAARGALRLAAMGVIAIAAVLLIESQSKTSQGLAVLAPSAGFALCLLTRWTRITPALLVPAGVGALYLVYVVGAESHVWDFEALATFFFGDPTLTRRTEIWDFALKMIERRPWGGFGYEAFWGVSFESPGVREAPPFIAKLHSGHNGYLDLIIHTGFAGFALAMAAVLALLHAAGRLARHSALFGTLLLSLIVFNLGYNIMETAFFRSFDLQHMIFLLTLALAVSAQDIVEGQGHA